MKNIVGGLLVLVLLSRPQLLKTDFVTYEVYKAQHNIIALIRKSSEEDEKTVEPEDVDGMLSEIGKNNFNIKSLIKLNKQIVESINKIMGFKAKTKEVLTEDQMTAYSQYSGLYRKEIDKLNCKLMQIENQMEDSRIKHEICSSETDFTQVYKELKAINDNQFDAIYSLNNIVIAGEAALGYF